MERVLVTGANGFIGSYLVKKLVKENKEVFAMVRDEGSEHSELKDMPEVHIIYSKMENYKHLSEIYPELSVDTIYHLAWEGVSGERRADYKIQLDNVRNSCYLMEWGSQSGCKKFLCSGTISELLIENTTQKSRAAQNNIYAICKNTAYQILSVLAKVKTVELVWMRLANAYGPRKKGNNIVDYVLNELKNNRSPEMGKGEQPYDLMFIDDLVNAIYLLGEKQVTKSIYYVGTGKPELLKTLVKKICDTYPGDYKARFGARKEDGLEYRKEWFDIKDMEEDTGFKIAYSLEEGIQKTIKTVETPEEL